MLLAPILAAHLLGCAVLNPVTMGDPDPAWAERPEARMVAVSPSLKPKAPKRPAMALTVARPRQAADTLVMTVAVTWGPDDNKGPVDSAVVRVQGGWWTPPLEHMLRGPGPYPTSFTFKAPIDYTLGSGGTATYTIQACAFVWRYGLVASTCSTEVPWNVTYPPPPSPASVGLTVTKVP